ncbi:GNAT family N-acetyltransferase [Ciceribacter sp. L1K22]|uniref:GNAT family N-acetyltransferase n=1 Tax=Ciceribacter sp. L1K22 TaxID=2820275 RepID=UPI001ABEBCF7|nr:GNAT family N-acetyltransferase [Ciceribacter sp. L1K22]MBO3759348.1 GNAT family N-acetyltransferase [Ciceribacter sp. L1K22]
MTKTEYSFERPVSVAPLQVLFRQTDWADRRSDTDVALMIRQTPVQIGAWQGDRLVGYARVLTEGRFRALIDDVVVDAAHRGAGIGSEIMRRLLARLDGVEEVFLLTGDDKVDYYARLGFHPSGAKCLRWRADASA